MTVCHPSVLRWTAAAVTAAEIAERAVLEVGAYDVNGSVRPLLLALQPASYLGVDSAAGPGVDRVVRAEDLEVTFGTGAFGVVVSTEMLEHARDWQMCLRNMATVLAPSGLLLLTTRSPGFPYHPFPDDHWRFTEPLMAKALDAAGLDVVELIPDIDPTAPGVFVKASKPEVWCPDWDALAGLEAEVAPR